MKSKKIIMFRIILMVLFLIPLTSAQLTFASDEPANIKLSCFDGFQNFCSATATCNITIFYPNMSLLVNNSKMTNGGAYFNYTTAINLTERGEYNSIVKCEDGAANGYTSFTFLVTNIGGTTQGNVAIGILFALLGLSFLFMYIGFKLTQSDTMFPFSLFFILAALILGIYTVQLGYNYNQELLFSNMGSHAQFTIYLGVLWGLIALSFLGMLLMIIKVVGELKERKSMMNYGEGWNPKLGQYN